MKNELLSQRPRIEVADALRGLAVMAILLLHNIEHFNLYNFPQSTTPFFQALDKGIWDTLFFLFAGKAYAIFALLFGFSFFIMFDNQEKRGKDFRLRFLWRMVLLFLIGCVNAAFFPGEILVLYSIIGLILIPVCKLNNKVLFCIAVILMLQPMEWAKFLYALFHPDYTAGPAAYGVHARKMYPFLEGDSFWAMIKSNLWDGQLFSLLWAWGFGRFFQTASLFILGFLLGRKQFFQYGAGNRRFWLGTLCVAIGCFIPLFILTDVLPGMLERKELLTPMKTIVSSLRNFSFMWVWVALVVIGWQVVKVQSVLKVLSPLGRMSLTNYLMQSLLGSFIYFGPGLGLYKVLPTTASFGVGILLLILQLLFCHWWLRNHTHGPAEWLWRKATWIGSKKS
ncbi:DUF418 domain-containing protein [Parabacteroides sp. 52]|uniref:DUF418 domain-containing protein n=1 Tax=unclassified Parabacteroides TaxID=2649774 RepID=UPI0013D059CD|nr:MULTISPECIES: DUF418 domain-containing protein [unclassified Parabacteroides]MDH6533580.1 uncharacterized protein [Parabacteroides sp. PM5-20]NDV54332.1 DUF418 domain-containing protein [Parabacteroides sp. 52]